LERRVNDLERYFLANTGGQISKWMHYFEIYERHFARYRGTDVHVLEIGVAHGGSLKMWKEYFGPKAQICGVDIQPAAKALEEPRIQILIGDQANADFLRTVAVAFPRIDILIDDGGHSMRQQEVTFKTLFPHVSPDGVYLCEDMHTSYWADYGGGYKREGTFVELSKGLIDEMNAWHSRSPELAVSEFTKSAYGLHFYDSVLVIEKRPIQAPTAESRGVATIEWTSPYSPEPLNSVPPRPGRAHRIARRIPGHTLAARAVRFRRPR
jgi:hypothetical protein